MAKDKDFPIEKALKIVERELKKAGIDDPPVEKLKRDPFKVLLGCIVSLRTQDKVSGEVNKHLFSRIKSAQDLVNIDEKELAQLIYPAGFYRQKAKQMKQIGKILLEKYGGNVPSTLDELLKLPGVGRKTANLVLTVGFDKYGICVDTHVHRITNRWGYVHTKTPEETEQVLRKKLPKRWWKRINRLLVLWGQTRCRPRYPRCSDCPLAQFCPQIGVVDPR